MPRILIPGLTTSSISDQNENIKVTSAYTIQSAKRGVKSPVTSVDSPDNQVIKLHFVDGGEWIASVSDLEEIFGEKLRNDKNEIVIPDSIKSVYGLRGKAANEAKLKGIEFIKSELVEKFKDLAREKFVYEVGKFCDQNFFMKKPGLFKIVNGEPDRFEEKAKTPQHYLLFIHGTASSFQGSFKDLFSKDKCEVGEAIKKEYGDNVLAFQHYTLHQSPFKNAIDILKSLPKACTIDIISHSRGGIIADILACCDKNTLDNLSGSLYSTETIVQAKKMDPNKFGLAEELKELNKLAALQKVQVKKIIRVASPAQGTTLLDTKFEYFLNTILKSLSRVVPDPTVITIIKGLETLVTAIYQVKSQAAFLPGLYAMIPESFPQQLVNLPDIKAASKLMIIQGDADWGKSILQSLGVILTNILMREANDMVVNTASMSGGILREKGKYICTSKGSSTNHFAYFENENTQSAIRNAIITADGDITGFEYKPDLAQGDRGQIAGLFKKYKKFKADAISGEKPIVVLIPGIMGTQLSVNGNIIWADLIEIGKGRMMQLSPDVNSTVGTDYIIGQYYADLAAYLSDEYDVITFGYDWRISLKHAADQLVKKLDELKKHKQPIKIIAHSMGGVVVREVMRLSHTAWQDYMGLTGSQAILLGTPWRGSHLIVEAFTGHLKVVRQINFLDLGHSPQQLLSLYHSFEGMYQLLPLVEEEGWQKKQKWSDLKIELIGEKFEVPNLLDKFSIYKTEVNDWLKNESYDSIYDGIYYIAGKADCTTSGYEVINNKLKYFGTAEGDGSVTWELGIPPEFPDARLYFAHDTSHGELASDTRLFEGIKSILQSGSAKESQRLYSHRPVIQTSRFSRSASDQKGNLVERIDVQFDPVSNMESEAWNNLLNKPNKPIETSTAENPIYVSVVHGDLRFASYIVMAGHMNNESITGTETVINDYFKGKLSERINVGTYPGKVGENLILINTNEKPKGTIIVGLGDIDKFNAYQLRKTVEKAVLNYAMFIRDNAIILNTTRENKDMDTSITAVCMGTGYGRLSMDDALRAILSGVQKANTIIQDLDNKLKPISHIEFIEIYEHIAQNVYYQLAIIKDKKDNKLNLILKNGIDTKHGGRKKFQWLADTTWWHNMTTLHLRDGANSTFQFISSSGIARVEQENNFTSMQEIHTMLKEMALENTWNKDYAKTLFEVLIPYNLKDIIRQQNNILWKMDIDTASIPWEMFHDTDLSNEPTFVQAGLIRQLVTTEAKYRPMIRTKNALIIGNPDYSGNKPELIDLPGATDEADIVESLLKKNGIEVNCLNKKNKAVEIITACSTKEYKILHIAGHGQYENGKSGVVLSGGVLLNAEKIKNWSKIPEFAFINCCELGRILPGREKFYENRYKFAANIGTELINIGVHAVVVAGWPVNDDSAKVFASVLYEQLLLGRQFGSAVLLARKACYLKNPADNTWAAYQCYGDPMYTLQKNDETNYQGIGYITQTETLADLHNLLSKTRLPDTDAGKRDNIREKLIQLIEKAKKANLYKAPVQEKEAEVLSELNELKDAIARYGGLRTINKADYSIKSMEQYCNLRMKDLLKIKLKPSETKELEKLAINMRAIENDFKTLLFFGETPERLSLLGSAYKKMASIRKANSGLAGQKLPSPQKYLSQACDYYIQAYEHGGLDSLQQEVYPLSNLLILHAMAENNHETIVLTRKKTTILPFIDQTVKKLKAALPRHEEFWDDIALVNMLQARLCFIAKSRLKSQTDEILKLYMDAWKTGGGTQKSLQTEIEQTEFLMGFDIKGRDEGWMKEYKKCGDRMLEELKGMD